MEDLADNTRGLPPTQSYEATLQAAHQKMMETTTALQDDLDRLTNVPRGRPCTHSQSGDCYRTRSSSWQRRLSRSQRWARSSQWVENWARSPNPDHLQIHLQGKRAHSPDHTQNRSHRRVSFHMPEGDDTTTVREQVAVKLIIEDLETWLVHQAGQLGTPTWWRELEAIPDIEKPSQICQKDSSLLLCS